MFFTFQVNKPIKATVNILLTSLPRSTQQEFVYKWCKFIQNNSLLKFVSYLLSYIHDLSHRKIVFGNIWYFQCSRYYSFLKDILWNKIIHSSCWKYITYAKKLFPNCNSLFVIIIKSELYYLSVYTYLKLNAVKTDVEYKIIALIFLIINKEDYLKCFHFCVHSVFIWRRFPII